MSGAGGLATGLRRGGDGFPVGVSTGSGNAYVLVLYTVVWLLSLLFFLLYLVLRRARATSGPPAVPLGGWGLSE